MSYQISLIYMHLKQNISILRKNENFGFYKDKKLTLEEQDIK